MKVIDQIPRAMEFITSPAENGLDAAKRSCGETYCLAVLLLPVWLSELSSAAANF